MNRPYTILHMLVSIDNKITGDYMNTDIAQNLCEEYYRINREYRADAFCCGRITMEGSFTASYHPDLSKYENIIIKPGDYIATIASYYAISIDPHGRVGWKSSFIKDEDPGYDNAHIIEVVTNQASKQYLAYLQDLHISYIICGEDKIDVNLMNRKLYEIFKIKKLMLEGGGLTDTLFLQADSIDEISLVVVPIIEGNNQAKDLFTNASCDFKKFNYLEAKTLVNNGLWLNYKNKN